MGGYAPQSSLDTSYTERPAIRIGASEIFFPGIGHPLGAEGGDATQGVGCDRPGGRLAASGT